MRLQRVIIIVFCVFCETSLLYAESASGFLKECNTGCLNTKFTFDSEQTACTLGCQKQAADIGRLNVYSNSTHTAESASGFLKECNTGCLNTKFTFDWEQAACTLGCQKQAADIGRLDDSSDSGLTCPKAKLEMDKGLMRVGYDEYKRLDNFYSRYCL